MKNTQIEIKKKYIKWVLFAIADIVAILLLLFAYGYKTIEDRTVFEIDAIAEVINTTTNISKIGVSVDTDILNFGRMIVNKTNSTKIITINNPTKYTIVAYITVKGNISPYLSYPESIILEGNEEKNIYLRFHAYKIGNFSGNITVNAKIPTNDIAEVVLVLLHE